MSPQTTTNPADTKRRAPRPAAAAPLPGDANVLVGEAVAWREALDLVDRVASSSATVLLTGESGTGKEIVAR